LYSCRTSGDESTPTSSRLGALSDRTGRRKIFVLAASTVYGLAMFILAIASDFNGYLVGMAIGGLRFGTYVAVDLALVVDVLSDMDNAAKDLGTFNVMGQPQDSRARRRGHAGECAARHWASECISGACRLARQS
jgi:hypothetical protein